MNLKTKDEDEDLVVDVKIYNAELDEVESEDVAVIGVATGCGILSSSSTSLYFKHLRF